MADRQFKVVGKHLKDCFAVRNRKRGFRTLAVGEVRVMPATPKGHASK